MCCPWHRPLRPKRTNAVPRIGRLDSFFQTQRDRRWQSRQAQQTSSRHGQTQSYALLFSRSLLSQYAPYCHLGHKRFGGMGILMCTLRSCWARYSNPYFLDPLWLSSARTHSLNTHIHRHTDTQTHTYSIVPRQIANSEKKSEIHCRHAVGFIWKYRVLIKRELDQVRVNWRSKRALNKSHTF